MDVAYARTKTQILIPIDVRYTEYQRKSIALLIIKRIIVRTKQGYDKNNVAFNSYSKYSKAYINSLAFKFAGKTDHIDLTLTSNMLNSLQVIDVSTPGFVKIGIVNRNVLKAFNHIVGDTVPKRDFLGISDRELLDILKQFPLNKEEINKNVDFVKEEDTVTDSNNVTSGSNSNVKEPLTVIKKQKNSNISTIRNIENKADKRGNSVIPNNLKAPTSTAQNVTSVSINSIISNVNKNALKVAKEKMTEARINNIKRRINDTNMLPLLGLALDEDKIKVDNLQLLLILKELGFDNIEVELNDKDKIELLRKLFKLKFN